MERLITEGLQTICGGPFSFALEQGECVAISGPSGCGKTLLLRALADLDPAEGNVRLDGEDRRAMAASQWRRCVGWLPAESSWWHEGVRDHFLKGQESKVKSRRSTVGGPNVPMSGAVDATPSSRFSNLGQMERDEGVASTLGKLGFDEDVLGWRIERLSTGERQRLALFRLLWNEPQVLLLDEPTAALDRTNVRGVEKLIREYQDSTGAAVLWVSHDLEQIERATERHLQFFEGRLEAEE